MLSPVSSIPSVLLSLLPTCLFYVTFCQCILCDSRRLVSAPQCVKFGSCVVECSLSALPLCHVCPFLLWWMMLTCHFVVSYMFSYLCVLRRRRRRRRGIQEGRLGGIWLHLPVNRAAGRNGSTDPYPQACKYYNIKHTPSIRNWHITSVFSSEWIICWWCCILSFWRDTSSVLVGSGI